MACFPALEVPENIILVERFACNSCLKLQNVALAMNTVVGVNAFNYCSNLLYIFGTEESIVVIALQNRFMKLQAHSKKFYKSYHNTMTDEGIHNANISEQCIIDAAGLQQDCLGMTTPSYFRLLNQSQS